MTAKIMKRVKRIWKMQLKMQLQMQLNKQVNGLQQQPPPPPPLRRVSCITRHNNQHNLITKIVQAKKKKSSTFSRSEASSAAGGGIVDMVADNWKSFKVVGWGKKKEQQQSYIDLKNREFDIHEKANREAAELKRQELELKHKKLELKLSIKRDKDLRFYMKKIEETLLPIQPEKLKEMKQQIKELYELDF
ncbi:hypothetical protein Tco_0697375 [Tanacetum coccineum]